jgi:hypothetical protein
VDLEEIENNLEEERSIHDAGYINLNHFRVKKHTTQEGLIMFGGSFARALGTALFYADQQNALKIMRYWNHECEQHRILYEMYQAKLQAESKGQDKE